MPEPAIRAVGKAMVGEWTSFWSYRVGNYGSIVRIKDEGEATVVVDAGHRREIYR